MSHNTININVFNQVNEFGFGPDVLSGVGNAGLDRLNDTLTDIFDTSRFDMGFEYQSNTHVSIAAGGCVVPPDQNDCCHPEGSLRNENGKITTPGGYTIEATKQHEWIITGPDGKTTRIWGDPHVAEGDGGTWDFKRDSTFVLGDGTRINVKTAPWNGGSMTVTSGLEIISGNDRVNITGIDQGKGVVGDITQDGFAHSNCFAGNDVFVMGRETDDWAYQGREVVGSDNGGESFKLGDQLATGDVRPNRSDWSQTQEFFTQLLDYLFGDSFRLERPPRRPSGSTNPYYDGHCSGGPRSGQYDSTYHREFVVESLRLVLQMLRVTERLAGMDGTFSTMRNRSIYA